LLGYQCESMSDSSAEAKENKTEALDSVPINDRGKEWTVRLFGFNFWGSFVVGRGLQRYFREMKSLGCIPRTVEVVTESNTKGKKSRRGRT